MSDDKLRFKFSRHGRPPVRGTVELLSNEELTPPERALTFLDAAVESLTYELGCYERGSDRHNTVKNLLDKTREIKERVEEIAGD